MLPEKSKNQLTPSTWHTSCSPYLVAPHSQPARRHRVGSGKKADVPTPAPAAKWSCCEHNEPQLGSWLGTTALSCAAPGPATTQLGVLPPGKGQVPELLGAEVPANSPLLVVPGHGAVLFGEGRSHQDPTDPQPTAEHLQLCMHQELPSGFMGTNLAGEHNRQEEGWCRVWARQLLLLLLLLLVPPEVGLDGDGRLLGRVAEEPALAAGVRGDVAWDENRESG